MTEAEAILNILVKETEVEMVPMSTGCGGIGSDDRYLCPLCFKEPINYGTSMQEIEHTSDCPYGLALDYFKRKGFMHE